MFRREEVKMFWECPSAGSEACTVIPTRYGTLLLAISGAWNHPATPAHIVVSDFEWTTDSSIAVYAVIDEGGGLCRAAGANPGGGYAPAGTSLVGWFNGVTLELNADVIFANGFD